MSALSELLSLPMWLSRHFIKTLVNSGKIALYLISSPIFHHFGIILMSSSPCLVNQKSKEVGLDTVKLNLLEAGKGEDEGCFCFRLLFGTFSLH